MKGKKLLSWALSAALCMSAVTVPALAASFPDVAGHWAVGYVDDTVAKGIFVGIDGKFVPNRTITAGEVLATSARISVDKELRKQIGKDRQGDIKNVLGTVWVSPGKWEGEQYWFGDEYAVCLESGILSYPELKELHQSKSLVKDITKEDFALYLARAMQLEPMAKNLTSYALNFTDRGSISSSRERYIYVLNMYGIITGTDKGEFQPKKTVTRAEAAAMLSRATDFMKENGTSTELSEYAPYQRWVAGTIVSAAAGSKNTIILTLTGEYSGTKTISIPADTPIYENSMLAETTLLKAGSYARVNLGTGDEVISVRLSGGVETYTGTVVGLSEDVVLLDVGGVTRTMPYNRFTEVQVGTLTGGRSLIDLDGGYTNATCRVDRQGHMVSLRLTGGSRREEGLISAVEYLAAGATAITVSAFDGQLKRYTIPAGAAVTANGSLPLAPGALNAGYVGSHAALRVSNDNASNVVSVALDTAAQYLQGAVKDVSVDNGVRTITITDLSTNKATTYKVADSAVLAYQDTEIAYDGIKKDWYATARVSGKASGSELTALWAYPGSSLTEGTISSISYPSGTTKLVMGVTKADGSVSTFSFDMSGALPEVKRSGKTSTIDKLRTGDAVRVTVRYNSVTLMDATPQSANLNGVIREITQTASGVTMKVELDGGAGSASYTVSPDVSVAQDGKTISLYDLRIGARVAMVTSGDNVSSIEVEKSVSSGNQITGEIIWVNTTDKTILFRITERGMADKIVTVLAPTGTTIQDVSGGAVTSVSLSKLETGNVLDIHGSYVNDQFKAALIIRK